MQCSCKNLHAKEELFRTLPRSINQKFKIQTFPEICFSGETVLAPVKPFEFFLWKENLAGIFTRHCWSNNASLSSGLSPQVRMDEGYICRSLRGWRWEGRRCPRLRWLLGRLRAPTLNNGWLWRLPDIDGHGSHRTLRIQ